MCVSLQKDYRIKGARRKDASPNRLNAENGNKQQGKKTSRPDMPTRAESHAQAKQ